MNSLVAGCGTGVQDIKQTGHEPGPLEAVLEHRQDGSGNGPRGHHCSPWRRDTARITGLSTTRKHEVAWASEPPGRACRDLARGRSRTDLGEGARRAG